MKKHEEQNLATQLGEEYLLNIFKIRYIINQINKTKDVYLSLATENNRLRAAAFQSIKTQNAIQGLFDFDEILNTTRNSGYLELAAIELQAQNAKISRIREQLSQRISTIQENMTKMQEENLALSLGSVALTKTSSFRFQAS